MFFEKIIYYEFMVPTDQGLLSYSTTDPSEIQAYLGEGLEYKVHSSLVLALWFRVWLFFFIMACLLYGAFAFWVLTWE